MGVSLHKPETIEEAVRLKSEDSEALFLAGGQTLIAMMNAELVEPPALISLDRISDLKGIDRQPDGAIRIGAMTSHADIASSDRLIDAHAVVGEAARVIAHPAIRTLGTIGGAVSHGDPNADYPAALVAADARFEVVGPGGRREIAAADFFLDYMTTELQENELLKAVILPPAPDRSAGHYEKFSRVDGDFATASVAVTLLLDGASKIDWIRIAVGASGPTPVRVPAAEQSLQGSDMGAAAVAEAAEQIAAACDPLDDVRGSSDYRRLLIPRLVAKAVTITKSLAEA